jgi:hypothetical protein
LAFKKNCFNFKMWIIKHDVYVIWIVFVRK